MQRHAHQKLISIAISCWVLTVCLLGCHGDPCRDVNCNNGVCNEGECACQPGWTGARCDSLLRDRLVGNLWQNSLHCQTGSNLYGSTIVASAGAADEIDIHNLYILGDSVSAVVTTDTLWVRKQVYGQDYIEGLGTLQRNGLHP